MKFFLPDSQDLVDPSFDFETEQRNGLRIRQRDDLYAHELFREQPYDGLLVSMGIVHGFGSVGGRYSIGQRNRLLRVGVREFFRLSKIAGYKLSVMGDCGAFTYVDEKVPPYTVDEVLNFYDDCGFDMGVSVDHVILDYDPELDRPKAAAPRELRDRQSLTLELALQFRKEHRARGCTFEPLGVAQGWSPRSYANSVRQLQKMGYRYVALGGMVPLKSNDILTCLEAVNAIRRSETRLHLLGVTRTEHVQTFERCGVVSFDSTTPLRQAFKDDRDNYYSPAGNYVAIRVPQVDGNLALERRIAAGAVHQREALQLEAAALDALRMRSQRRISVANAVDRLIEYEELCLPAEPSDSIRPGKVSRREKQLRQHREDYTRALTDEPWRTCGCEVCKTIGHHVILFRGAERNRRRGMHNVWTFYRHNVRRVPGRTATAAA